MRTLRYSATASVHSDFAGGLAHRLWHHARAAGRRGPGDPCFRGGGLSGGGGGDTAQGTWGWTGPCPGSTAPGYGAWRRADLAARPLESREPIREIVARRFPVTVQLALLTLAITLVVIAPAGCDRGAAARQAPGLPDPLRLKSWGSPCPISGWRCLVILGKVSSFMGAAGYLPRPLGGPGAQPGADDLARPGGCVGLQLLSHPSHPCHDAGGAATGLHPARPSARD